MQVSVGACSHEASHQGSIRVRLKSPVPDCQDAELVLEPPGAAGTWPEALVPLPAQTPAFVILEVRTVRASRWAGACGAGGYRAVVCMVGTPA